MTIMRFIGRRIDSYWLLSKSAVKVENGKKVDIDKIEFGHMYDNMRILGLVRKGGYCMVWTCLRRLALFKGQEMISEVDERLWDSELYLRGQYQWEGTSEHIYYMKRNRMSCFFLKRADISKAIEYESVIDSINTIVDNMMHFSIDPKRKKLFVVSIENIQAFKLNHKRLSLGNPVKFIPITSILAESEIGVQLSSSKTLLALLSVKSKTLPDLKSGNPTKASTEDNKIRLTLLDRSLNIRDSVFDSNSHDIRSTVYIKLLEPMAGPPLLLVLTPLWNIYAYCRGKLAMLVDQYGPDSRKYPKIKVLYDMIATIDNRTIVFAGVMRDCYPLCTNVALKMMKLI